MATQETNTWLKLAESFYNLGLPVCHMLIIVDVMAVIKGVTASYKIN